MPFLLPNQQHQSTEGKVFRFTVRKEKNQHRLCQKNKAQLALSRVLLQHWQRHEISMLTKCHQYHGHGLCHLHHHHYHYVVSISKDQMNQWRTIRSSAT